MKQDMTKAVQFNNTFRYINDLCSVINDNFGCINAIYPSELEPQLKCVTLTRESIMSTVMHLAILLSTTREMMTSHFGLYRIWTATFPQNHGVPAYGVCIFQLVRYARICASKLDFIYRPSQILSRLSQQGFKSTLLLKSYNKFFKRHSAIVEKYGTSLWEIGLAVLR